MMNKQVLLSECLHTDIPRASCLSVAESKESYLSDGRAATFIFLMFFFFI